MNSLTVPYTGRNTVCIDFDGVIIPFMSDLYAEVAPIYGAIPVIRQLHDLGYEIVIMTSRMSTRWHVDAAGDDWIEFAQRQYEYVAGILTKHGIPYDVITAEKVPAIFYLDDRAIHFTGDWSVALDDIDLVLNGDPNIS